MVIHLTRPDNERRPAGKRSAEDRPGRKINTESSLFGLAKTEIETLVDLAVNSGAVVAIISAELVVVPDTMLLEAEANGNPYNPTTLLRREDGRTAAIYRFPEVTL